MNASLDPHIPGRIAARKLCEEIVLLVAGEVRDLTEAHGDVAANSFWEHFRTAFSGHFPQQHVQEHTSPPMTDDECRRFGSTPMPAVFKKYAGIRVDETPMDYLEYIDVDETKWFREQLNRYLRSRRIQQEQSDL